MNKLKYSLAKRLCVYELEGRESEVVDIIDSSDALLNDFDELRSHMVALNWSTDIDDEVNVTFDGKHYVLTISHSCHISPFISQVAMSFHLKDNDGKLKFVSHANEYVEYEDGI